MKTILFLHHVCFYRLDITENTQTILKNYFWLQGRCQHFVRRKLEKKIFKSNVYEDVLCGKKMVEVKKSLKGAEYYLRGPWII